MGVQWGYYSERLQWGYYSERLQWGYYSERVQWGYYSESLQWGYYSERFRRQYHSDRVMLHCMEGNEQNDWNMSTALLSLKPFIEAYRTYRSFATRVSKLQIWHFWVIGTERNVCRCTFNRYRIITQFAKLATGEQFCRRCTHRKLQHFKTFKSFSWKNHRFWVVTLLWQIGSDIIIQGGYMLKITCVKNIGTPVTCRLTLRLLMSYTYGAPILDVSRSHTTTQHSR